MLTRAIVCKMLYKVSFCLIVVPLNYCNKKMNVKIKCAILERESHFFTIKCRSFIVTCIGHQHLPRGIQGSEFSSSIFLFKGGDTAERAAFHSYA